LPARAYSNNRNFNQVKLQKINILSRRILQLILRNLRVVAIVLAVHRAKLGPAAAVDGQALITGAGEAWFNKIKTAM
jgi:hypothetical protein